MRAAHRKNSNRKIRQSIGGVEPLETRRLLAAIVGEIYIDTNANGAEDAGETYFAGVKVYVDSNNNSSPDAGEPFASTNNLGKFEIGGLAAGTYRLRQVVPGNYTVTEPAAGFADVTTTEAVPGDQDFGDAPINPVGTIRGSIFNDVNGDALQNQGEPYQSGVTAYIDSNLNGSFDAGEPSSVTDGTGYFVFQTLTPGNYRIREVPPANSTTTRPALGYYDVQLAGGQNVFDRIFGNHNNPTDTGAIAGNVYSDFNSDGVRQANETGLDGWTLYIDKNLNGSLDAGEITTTSYNGGAYYFQNLGPGNYRVREISQAGWTQTGPAGGFYDITLTQNQQIGLFGFGNHKNETPVTGSIAGNVFNDANSNGVQDANDVGLAGWTLYIDANLNGSLDAGEKSVLSGNGGAYSFTSVPAGSYRVREITPQNWTQTAPQGGFFDISLAAGQTVGDKRFGNHSNETPTVGAIAGSVFGDSNSDGIRQSTELGLSGWTLYIDTNLNGALDAGETNVLSGSTGAYSIPNLTPGTYRVREVLKPGWTQTAPAGGFFDVTVAAGQTVGDRNFGDRENPTTGYLYGTVFNDLDSNGQKGANEPVLPGWTVYLDTNNNGLLDGAEVSQVTNANGVYAWTSIAPGNYHVREVVQQAWTQTAPASGVYDVTIIAGQGVGTQNFGNHHNETPVFGAISGVVYNDSNSSSARDGGEVGLANWVVYLDLNNNSSPDANEPTAQSNANGEYLFGQVAPGSYRVREIKQDGWRQTQPENSYLVSVAANQTISNLNFGNTIRPLITGTIYNDLNHDGSRQSGEPGLVGWRAFIDLNNNTVFDVGEPSALTNANGLFAFKNLFAGTGTLREVAQPNWTPTSPPAGWGYTGTVVNGQIVGGLNFGNYETPATPAPLAAPQTSVIVSGKFNAIDLFGDDTI